MSLHKSRGTLSKPIVQTCLVVKKTGVVYNCVVQDSSSFCLGLNQDITYEPGTRFKAGILSRNPVVLIRQEGSCSEMEIRSGMLPSLYSTNKLVKGHLAAWKFVPPAVPVWPTSTVAFTNNRALAEINKPGMELGTFIGELAGTLQMVRSPFKTLHKRLKRARSRHKKLFNGRHSLQAMNDAFLEISYGWLPLMRDVDQMVQYHYTKGAQTLSNLRSKHGRRVSKSITRAVTARTTGNMYWTEEAFTETETKVVSAQYYRYLENQYERANSHFWGMSSSDIIPTAWALAPYSFVVDWFVDVGSWAQALMPPQNIRRLGGTDSVKTTQSVTIHTLPRYYCNLETTAGYLVGDSVLTWSRTVLDRRLSDASVGVIPAVNPAWLNLGQAVSGTSLLLQRCLNNLLPRKR